MYQAKPCVPDIDRYTLEGNINFLPTENREPAAGFAIKIKGCFMFKENAKVINYRFMTEKLVLTQQRYATLISG